MRVYPKKLICKNDDVWSLLSKVDVTLYPSSNLAKKGSVARDDVPRSSFRPAQSLAEAYSWRQDVRLIVVSLIGTTHRPGTARIVIYQTLLRTVQYRATTR